MKTKLTFLLILLFAMFGSLKSYADSGFVSFTATGYDDDPTTITVAPSDLLSVVGSTPIDSIHIVNLSGAFATSYCSSWYDFDLSIDGTTQISGGCMSDFDGYSVPTNFTTVVFTSNDLDNYSDGVTMTFDMEVFFTPTCPAPTNVMVSGLTSATATVAWTTGGSANWNLEYGPAGFTQGTGTVVTGVTNPYTITGLTSVTSYDVYVQDSCGVADVSAWTGPANFMTTPIAINAFPYTYDFESSSINWAYFSASESQASLEATGGNPNGNALLTGNTYNGWSSYSTVDQAFANASHVSSLLAAVDATSLTNVRFEFDMRMSYSYNTTYGWARVMINGTDYAKDLNGDSTWNATTTNADPFQTLAFDLSAYAGTSFTISIEYAGKYDATNYGYSYGDELHVDNVNIYQPVANDLAMSALFAPTAGFEMSNTMDVSVLVYNNGVAAQSGYDISYSIDGGATFVTQNIATSIAAGVYDTLTFTTQADLSTVGVKSFVLAVSNSGDADNSNDTITASTEHLAFPYNDGFENYLSSSIPDFWNVINNTGNAYADIRVNTYGGYNSPNCLYFSNSGASTGDLMSVLPADYGMLSNKAMKIWFKGSVGADLYVGVMTDPNDPTTFVAVDTLTAGSAYTQYPISFSSYSGSGQFVAFKHGMGSSYQSFYIDDIELYEPIPNDMMMLSWDAPKTAIDHSSGTVKVSVYNNGTVAQSNIPVAYSVDAGTTIVYDTITATVNPGDTFQFSFATPATFAYGVNNCGAVVNNGDLVPANDTVFYDMTNYAMPFMTDFEDAVSSQMPNGWTAVNNNAGSGYAYAYSYSYYAHSGSIALKLYNSSAVSGDLIAALPEYGGATVTDKWITFWHKGYATDSLIVGVMSDVSDASTFVGVDTIRPTDGYYHKYATNFSTYAGSGKYVAFKHGMGGTYHSLYIDDVTFEVAPTAAIYHVTPDTNFVFGSVRYNYPDTLTQEFTISNDGVGNMVITNPILGGINDTNFVLVDTNTYPKSLAMFESLSFKVKFGGSVIGTRSATISLTRDGVNDSIVLTGSVVDPIISTFPYVENFDDHMIDFGWSLKGGSYKWQFKNNQTPSSGTGPLGDLSGSGYYIYTEASSGSQGDVASIYTNPIDMSSLSGAKLNYWYHMYGATIDTFSVEIAQNGAWTVVDTINGQQQTAMSDPWLMHSIDLSAYAATLIDSVRFKAIRGSSYTGDISIDNIAFGSDPVLSLTDTSACDVTSIMLDATIAGNYNYTWTDLATNTVVGNSATLLVTASGDYAVTLIDEGYFTSTDTVTVNLYSSPVPTMSPDVAICEGDSTVISAGPASAAPGVFFSEYIEGSSNNKALEIYNGTSATINLDEYSIMTNYNGNPWSGQYHFPAGATLAAGDVFVIANDQSNVAILAVADDTLAYNAGGYVVGFNGDDVRALFHKTSATDSAIVDIIGAYDLVDPGKGWDVAGVSEATKDHSLIRKSTVMAGDTSWTAIAGVDSLTSQYLVYPKNDFSHLGSHMVAAGNLTYLWSTGETTASISVSPTTTTTYTVTVDNGHCQAMDSVVVTVNALPVVNLGNDTTIKWTNGSVTLDAGNPNATWLWNTGATTQTETFDNTNLTNAVANTVYVTVTENGCSASDSLVITVMDDVSINGALDNMDLNVYPNPTKGQFNMAINGFEGDLDMTIVNLAGQTVYSEKINVTPSYVNKFDVSSLSTGVYYIKLTTENGIKVLKLVIR